MAKAELGTKRLCPNCGAKYYDLKRSPIICPKCGTPFEAPTGRSRAQPAAVVAEEEVEAVEVGEVEVISLEEADEETGAVEEDATAEAEEDVFLEPDEEGEEDVNDIIGDVDEEER